MVKPWSPGIYHGKPPNPEGAARGRGVVSMINPWLPWYNCVIYPAPDWPSPYLHSYIATDLAGHSDSELCRLALSISSVSWSRYVRLYWTLLSEYYTSSSAMPGHTTTLECDLQQEVKTDVNSYLTRACAHTPQC